jgi:glycyl-tRNA synthetase beta chain
MADKRDFLVEIGTEELPPKALRRLAEAFADGVNSGLVTAELPHGELRYFASPRRMAVLVRDLAAAQPDRAVERRGPALNAAFDDEGSPTKAAQGFARSCGIAVDQLGRLENAQGAWLVYRSMQRGVATRELLTGIVEKALADLPTPKRMHWGSLRAEFVRPVHWLVMLFGDEVIAAELYGVRAGRETRGHRYHHPAAIYLSEPRAYAPLLETEGHVLVDFEMRKEAIRGQVSEAAKSVGGTAVIDEALLDEVTALVEWPVALLGDFETRFLALPPEPLISTMKGNQKYFHAVDDKGRLLPHFITVCNIDSRDPAQVRAGNERVIRPRFSDAAFFWEQDRKQKLETRLDSLKKVVFQNELGTLYDKVQRVMGLAGVIVNDIGGDITLARRAAQLSKCDLMTTMVSEFPELQGIMGHYYAEHDGEHQEVACALEEQYLPRHAGDVLPQTKSGQALAIADRLDTVVGIFGIDKLPSGDKDPFGLRRAALGVLRIIIERRLNLDLLAKTKFVQKQWTTSVDERKNPKFASQELADQVFDFMMERLRAYYIESDTRSDVFDAVLAQRPTRPYDFELRIRAVTAFREMPEAESLAAANKRIRNILKQSEESIAEEVSTQQLVEPAEQILYQRLAVLSDEVTPLFDAGEYTPALQRLAALREPVDAFFDKVMVMTDDEGLRRNRLALLARLNGLFLRAADFSRLQ